MAQTSKFTEQQLVGRKVRTRVVEGTLMPK